MSGRKASIGSTEPRLGGIRVQTSLYGQTVPVVFGTARIPGNLLWYGNFQAQRQEERAEAGKGGASRPTRLYYTYSASVAMLLAEGPVAEVLTVWKGKQRFSGQPTSTTNGTAVHDATVPGSPHAVTVPAASTWTGTVRVYVPDLDPYDWPPYDEDLVLGIDYTVAAGVYTFSAARAGAVVRIEYTTRTTTESVDALAQLGLVLVRGEVGQPTWQYLVESFPDEAVPYAGYSYIRGQDHPLSSAAEVENHNFEVRGQFAIQTDGDAHPADVLVEMTTNTRYGVGVSSGFWADIINYRHYCFAYGLRISPAFLEQRPARDWMADILDATNTDACWTGSRLKLIPRGDVSLGNYVAPTTPVAAIGPDDMLGPLRIRRAPGREVPNVLRVEYSNRSRDYQIEPQVAEDEASIITYGRREATTRAYHFIADAGVARTVAQLELQRLQASRVEWECDVPWRFAFLERGDIVLLTDPDHELVDWPAKILDVREQGEDGFRLGLEDYPAGHGTAPIIAPQIGSGFRPDLNADPGNVAAPAFIEPPGGYTTTGLEVWAAVSGQAGEPGRYWGGAEVYCSLDGGASYKLVGRVDQGGRYGALTALLAPGSGGVLSVELAGRGGQLRAVSPAEADALATLAYVGDAATGEWIAHQAVELVYANGYNLSGLRRGRFNSTDRQHPSGSQYVLLDGALAMSGPLAADYIGRELHFKFCSFNVFGGGLQSLAQVDAYTYTPTGRWRDVTELPLSGNEVAHATLTESVRRWTPIEITLPPGSTTFAKHPLPGYSIPGSPSSAVLTVASVLTGDGHASGVISDPMPVEPGKRYVGYAGLVGWGTDALVGLAWYNAAGQFIDVAYADTVVGVPVESAQRRLNDPAAYRRSIVFASPPVGATTRRLAIYASGGWLPGLLRYVSVHRPFSGEVRAGVTTAPAWDAGSSSGVDTIDIRDDAISVTYSNRLTASRVVPGRPPPDQSYIAQLPNIFMPPHDGSIPAGARLQVMCGLNLQTVLAATSGERTEITLILGLAVLEYDTAGTTLISGLTYPAGIVYQQFQAVVAGRTLYGSVSFELDLIYRADRRYLLGMAFSDPVSGTPPDAWQQTALAGSHVTITVHKTSRAT
jgi:hypothetical protein